MKVRVSATVDEDVEQLLDYICKNSCLRNKRGQVFVWVIIALVIVVTIFFIIFARKQTEDVKPGEQRGFVFSIRECLKNSIDKNTNLILKNGGFVEAKNYVNYSGKEIEYLCKTDNYYESCNTLHPTYISEIQDEYSRELKKDSEKCFTSLSGELERNKYKVEYGENRINVAIAPDRVFVYINKTVKISREDEQNYDEFNFEFSNPVYNLAEIANEIVFQESKYCYFDNLGYQILYNQVEIEKDNLNDGTRIYTIKDKHSGKELNIAIRGCVIPPGI